MAVPRTPARPTALQDGGTVAGAAHQVRPAVAVPQGMAEAPVRTAPRRPVGGGPTRAARHRAAVSPVRPVPRTVPVLVVVRPGRTPAALTAPPSRSVLVLGPVGSPC